MNKATGIKLYFIVILDIIFNLPYLCLRKLGLFRQSKFEFANKVVIRPKHLSSRKQRIAFDEVGSYAVDGLTRCVMLIFTDEALKNKNNPFLTKNIPVEVWHQVLEYFVECGVIEQRWILHIPIYVDRRISRINEMVRFVPKWDKNGSPLQKNRYIESPTHGFIPSKNSFNPELLTDDQKILMISKQYALCFSDDKCDIEYILKEDNFTRIFYRSLDVLSKDSKDYANDRLNRFRNFMSDN